MSLLSICQIGGGACIPIKTHLNVQAMSILLAQYPDPWVLRGATHGWPLSRDRTLPLSCQTWPNHASCHKNMDQVTQFFADEISFGAIYSLGHAPASLPPPVSTIPLLCVPKPPSLTKVRVCGDMSFPPGFSVNDGIPTDSYEGSTYRCRLPSIWDFIAQIRSIGIKDAVISKADFSRGYRQIPIDPSDWLKQMFHLPGKGYYMDTRAIFGGRPCALMMQRTHQGLAWISINTTTTIDESELLKSEDQNFASAKACSPYIDDSLQVAHRACAQSAWENLLSVFKATNVKLSTTEGHICPPSRSMRALGFDLDLDAGTVSLPIHKLHEMLEFTSHVLHRGSVTRHDIKRLLGRISRCIMVIREGRRFIGRLLLLLQGPPLPANTLVKVPETAKQDLEWWLTYGPRLNSKTLLSLPPLPLTSVFLVDGRVDPHCPATVGGLNYHTKEFFSMQVPDAFQSQPIHIIEAIVLLAASRLWVSKMPDNHLIPIGSDNQAVVLAFQHGRAREPSLAAMARLLWGVFATSTCSFYLRYVPSKENSSDGISRLNEKHVDFLRSQNWAQLNLPDQFFSLDESKPFSYQEAAAIVLP